MKAECLWQINGTASHSNISDVLRPWPELRTDTLQNASPMDDDDPGGDCSFGLDVKELDKTVRILARFIEAGAGYNLSLFVKVETPFGDVQTSLGRDYAHALVYPKGHDAKITEAATAARNLLEKALKGGKS